MILAEMEGVSIHSVDLFVNVKSVTEEVCAKKR